MTYVLLLLIALLAITNIVTVIHLRKVKNRLKYKEECVIEYQEANDNLRLQLAQQPVTWEVTDLPAKKKPAHVHPAMNSQSDFIRMLGTHFWE
jgi:hypothetical protein